MSQPKPPVPQPRRRKSEDDKPLKCTSPPQSPTQSPEGGLVRSAPPPVLPKRWTVKNGSGGGDNGNGRLEIVKVFAEQSVNDNCKAQPPPMPAKPPKEKADDENENENLDADSLKDWWTGVTPWNCLDKELKGEKEAKIMRVKAQQIYNAIKLYINLLSEHGGTLKDHINELECIADNLDKVSKGTKIAGITGGATTVAGGVAAAAGVILSPFTLGASLALTAVGVGVAAAGGVTGASAAIANKVSATQDKKKIEKTLKDYDRLVGDIQACLKFVNEGMGQLKQHDLSILDETRIDSVRVVRELSATGGASAGAMEANSKASGLIQGFALGMDFYFTQGKNGLKLKKSLASKFGKKIRTLAEELKNGLEELMKIKDSFSELCSEK